MYINNIKFSFPMYFLLLGHINLILVSTHFYWRRLDCCPSDLVESVRCCWDALETRFALIQAFLVAPGAPPVGKKWNLRVFDITSYHLIKQHFKVYISVNEVLRKIAMVDVIFRLNSALWKMEKLINKHLTRYGPIKRTFILWNWLNRNLHGFEI